MARASAWGLGSALAYESLDIDAQARLLALYAASRQQEGDEARGVVLGALGEFAHAALEGIVAAKGKVNPRESVGRGRDKPQPPAVAARKPQPPSRQGALPDILRVRTSLEDTLKL